MDCNICCERFNHSNHSKVNCGFCTIRQCTSCAERYILDSSDDPHCMNCKTGWDTAKLVENFTKKFVTKDLKKRREDLLFERERALMPATQAAAERAMKVKNYTSEFEQLQERVNLCNIEITKIMNSTDPHDPIKAYEISMPKRRQMYEFIVQRDFVTFKLHQLTYSRRAEPVKRFIRCCPGNDCKGFLSTAWKCGLCGIKACSQCHEIKHGEDDEHVCLKENLETARLLERDTRPCPKCASMIFKIDGCDQMWCTQCQTTFSWRTGQVEAGRTHNPHYYEYLRRQNNGQIPREPGDVPRAPDCNINNYPDPYIMNAALVLVERARGNNLRHIMEILRTLIHDGYVIQSWAPVRYTPQLHEELRIKYMINDITEEVYKKELQKQEKARNKRRDMHDILSMFETVAREIMHKILREASLGQGCTVNNINEAIIELDALRTYSNEHMVQVAKRYGCVYPRIAENWLMISAKA